MVTREMPPAYGARAATWLQEAHQVRHFLLTWQKKQGIDDALIQPYSGHASRQSLEIYSRLTIGDSQREYEQVIGRFPI